MSDTAKERLQGLNTEGTQENKRIGPRTPPPRVEAPTSRSSEMQTTPGTPRRPSVVPVDKSQEEHDEAQRWADYEKLHDDLNVTPKNIRERCGEQ